MSGLGIMRRRMRNSGLTAAPFGGPAEAVRHHLAMQAQDYGPAKWSVGQRSESLVDEDLDRALAEGTILRTHVLRPTWHFVAREDIRWLLKLTGPRVQRHIARRYRELGLDGMTLGRSHTAIASALGGGNQLSRYALGGVLGRAGLDPEGQRLPYVLMHCELEGVICSGALQGKRHSYALLDERVPGAEPFDRDRALVELVRRYLKSHGPSTVQDLRWWSSLTIADIRKALAMLGSGVQRETIDGVEFWSMDARAGHLPTGRGAHLLQAYDELIVGYTASRFFGDPSGPTARSNWRDRSLPNALVLVDGRVAGHWRRTMAPASVTVEVLLYEEPSTTSVRSLEAAAAVLGRFLGRPAKLEAKPPARVARASRRIEGRGEEA